MNPIRTPFSAISRLSLAGVCGALLFLLAACGGASDGADGPAPARSKSAALDASDGPKAQGTVPVYRFYNRATGAHFYTASASERDRIRATLPVMSYDGPAFEASPVAAAGLSPVHRFYNRQTGVHFYTISEAERAQVQANLPQFLYEGIAYYASTVAGPGLRPLSRFYLAGKGYHFYTVTPTEVAYLPQYAYEGTGYHVFGSEPATIRSYGSFARAALGPGAPLYGALSFPADNPWNQDVSALPVDPNSDALIASIGQDTGLHPDFGSGFWEGAPIGIPYVVVSGAQARVPMVWTAYGDESDPGPYPVPVDAPVEGGRASNGDRHVIVIDRDNQRLYEIGRAFPQTGGAWFADVGALFHLDSNNVRPGGQPGWTSADAPRLHPCDAVYVRLKNAGQQAADVTGLVIQPTAAVAALKDPVYGVRLDPGSTGVYAWQFDPMTGPPAVSDIAFIVVQADPAVRIHADYSNLAQCGATDFACGATATTTRSGDQPFAQGRARGRVTL